MSHWSTLFKAYKCLPADIVLASNSWEKAGKKLQCANKFSLVIFISHRWASPNNPDPTNRQYKAIQKLIQHIVAGVHAISAIEKSEHHRYIPDLGRHGVLQGAMIATRLLATIYELPYKESVNIILENKPERLIGIWYDSICLPQEEHAKHQLQSILQNLPDFVQHPQVSVIALRESRDDYEQRGWCMMEFMLASRQKAYYPLIYRYDLEGKTLQINYGTSAGLTFNALLQAWRDSNKETAFKCWQSIFLQVNFLADSIALSEENTPTLCMRTTLSEFVGLQSGLFIAEKTIYPAHDPLDILRKLQIETDLLTTLPEDGILVYLMILVGGCSLESALGKEFQEYLEQTISHNLYKH